MVLRRPAVVLVALLIAACSTAAPPRSLAVGAGPDAVSTLLAHVYAAALQSYGSPAHVEPSPDPVADLDSGDVEVVPGLTGRLLVRFDPDAPARGSEQVYRSMLAALPEGIAAGDYAQSAEDEPALAVTDATAKAWGGRDVAKVPAHCRGLTVGAVTGNRTPGAISVYRLPAAVQFPTADAMFAALRSGRVGATWTTTAATGVPEDVVVLGDRTSAVRAENVVPLYRRNVLDERQVLALNEIAGELDTGSLTDMLGKIGEGVDPGAVAAEWLAAHPLGK